MIYAFLFGVIVGVIVDGAWWFSQLNKLASIFEKSGIEGLEKFLDEN